MIIGYHQLPGKVVTLKKPLAVLEKQFSSVDEAMDGTSREATSYQVLFLPDRHMISISCHLHGMILQNEVSGLHCLSHHH